MQINIITNLQVEGTHSWSECPIAEVSFLRSEHRHIFHICCKSKVEHADRDIEIIMQKRRVTEFLHNEFGTPCIFKNMSCEMIAKQLMNKFDLVYCSVMEDGENGAEIYK